PDRAVAARDQETVAVGAHDPPRLAATGHHARLKQPQRLARPSSLGPGPRIHRPDPIADPRRRPGKIDLSMLLLQERAVGCQSLVLRHRTERTVENSR